MENWLTCRKSLLGGKMSRRNGVLLCSSVCSKALTEQNNMDKIREREQQQQQPKLSQQQQRNNLHQLPVQTNSNNRVRPVVPQPGTVVSSNNSFSSNSGSGASDHSDTESQFMYNNSQQPNDYRQGYNADVGSRYGDFTDGRADLPAWRPLLHARHHHQAAVAPPSPPVAGRVSDGMPLTANRHVQFANDMLNSSGESTVVISPHRSPTSRDVASRPDIFTFAETDMRAQKYDQPAAGRKYRRSEVGGDRQGQELGGGRLVQGQDLGGGRLMQGQELGGGRYAQGQELSGGRLVQGQEFGGGHLVQGKELGGGRLVQGPELRGGGRLVQEPELVGGRYVHGQELGGGGGGGRHVHFEEERRGGGGGRGGDPRPPIPPVFGSNYSTIV